MLRRGLLALTALASFGWLASGVAHAAGPRVMPLGDSLTELPGYRRPLAAKLKAAGREVEWVGSMVDGDLHHEGHSGAQIQTLLDNVQTWVGAARPDIILLQIGTNDMWRQREFDAGNLDQKQLPAPMLDTLLARLFELAPQASIIVSRIPPMTQYDPQTVPADQKATVAAEVGKGVKAYVDRIPDLVAGWVAKGKAITSVDMYDAISVNDLVDGVHPNDAGFGKMADTWYPALLAAMDSRSGNSADAGAPAVNRDAGAAPDAGRTATGGTAGGAGGQAGGASGGSGGRGGAAPGGQAGTPSTGGKGGDSGAAGNGGRGTGSGGTGGGSGGTQGGGSKGGCSYGGPASPSALLFGVALATAAFRKRRARAGR